MSAFRYEISTDMMLDIARDRREGATWAWLSYQYGIPPKSLQRAFLRKSAEVYGPQETQALLDRARQQVAKDAAKDEPPVAAPDPAPRGGAMTSTDRERPCRLPVPDGNDGTRPCMDPKGHEPTTYCQPGEPEEG